MAKLVYSFGGGKADGRADMKDLLGGKGANLAEMTRLGIPVPPGFTISTRSCNLYLQQGGKLPADLKSQVGKALSRLERQRGLGFGDRHAPLLVSVRSGAKFSMPGMMDTILNLGLNARSVEGLAQASGDRRFAYDSYRRFIQMYGDVVLEIPKHLFDRQLDRLKKRKKVRLDTELSAGDLEGLVERYLAIVEQQTGKSFPQSATRQLWGAITAVFRSWNNRRARLYRRQYGIADDLGTAVTVQCMVFGNLGEDCATGVAFTRNPATGENALFGEYLINAQGEDVVAGIRTPRPIRAVGSALVDDSMERSMPEVFAQLLEIRRRLESHYRDMQDVEFTVERGVLYMLQTRTGKRTAQAALNIAFDLHRERAISRDEVVRRIEPEMLTQLLAPIFDPGDLERARAAGQVLARGLPAGPGAASGRIAFSAEKAEAMAPHGPVLLVRTETSPEDLAGMVVAQGIVTARGGMTSHAAVVARGMGKPCVVGAESLHIDEQRGELQVGEQRVAEGDVLSIDGATGEVLYALLTPHPAEIQQILAGNGSREGSTLFRRYEKLMRWADQLRELKVRTNADTPHDAAMARAFGAEGIGLCRTEHMFFGDDRISWVRQMILAEDAKERSRALRKLLPMQRKDFIGIFKAMDGLPVTIRLLDPPLHEFLPSGSQQLAALAKAFGIDEEAVRRRARQLGETNPMLGHRGCRLGITHPDVYDMQVRAIFEAAAASRRRGVKVSPEIMVPLIGTAEEFLRIDARVRDIAREVQRKSGQRVRFSVGTMIEIPRAALIAGAIAERAEFFSFGTNDLTQMTFGYSRDDVAKFLPAYVEQRIVPNDPFQSLDADGVGRLIEICVEEGRRARPKLKVGVCGEHGGDPRSVEFFHRSAVDYVSCSPFRVAVARLAAAQAAMQQEGETGTA